MSYVNLFSFLPVGYTVEGKMKEDEDRRNLWSEWENELHYGQLVRENKRYDKRSSYLLMSRGWSNGCEEWRWGSGSKEIEVCEWHCVLFIFIFFSQNLSDGHELYYSERRGIFVRGFIFVYFCLLVILFFYCSFSFLCHFPAKKVRFTGTCNITSEY